MPIGQEKNLKNPAKFYEWKGGEGVISTYNKKTNKNETIEKLQFVVLDQLVTLKGFDSKSSSGYWSNEIRNIEDDILILKNKNGIVKQGVYSTFKGLSDVKFTKVVYGYEVNTKELIAFLFYGSAVGSAIEADIKDGNKYTVYKNPEKMKKGRTEYYIPYVERNEVTDAEYNTAMSVYEEELKPYHNEYFKVNKAETKKENTTTTITGFNPADIKVEEVEMPF